MSKKSNLRSHQAKMIFAIRALDLNRFYQMTSYYLPDATRFSSLKYRQEVNKRMTRLFPISIAHARLSEQLIFEIASDFHFDFPSKILLEKIKKIGEKIKATKKKNDKVLNDLVSIELAIAKLYYGSAIIKPNLFGIPLNLQTNIWCYFPKIPPKSKLIFKSHKVRFDFDPYTWNLSFYNDPFSGRLNMKGDPHNFGQYTHFKRGKYIKPRELYWEYLFFGKDSPLIKIFPAYIVESFMQLTIDQKEKTSKKIKSSSPNLKNKSFMKNTGRLYAWCLSFGITDLHRGNIILQKNSPIVIDVETALLPYLEPSSAGLCERQEELRWAAGFGFLLEAEQPRDVDIKEIIDGFNEMMDLIESKSKTLISFFKKRKIEINLKRNRFVMRNSRDYEQALLNKKSTGLIPEELKQIYRKDVPYFFTLRSQKGVFFFNTPDGEILTVKKLPKSCESLLALHQNPIEKLFTKSRIHKLRKSGLKLLKEFVHFS